MHSSGWSSSVEDMDDRSVEVTISLEEPGAELMAIDLSVANAQKVTYKVLFAEYGDIEASLEKVVSKIYIVMKAIATEGRCDALS